MFNYEARIHFTVFEMHSHDMNSRSFVLSAEEEQTGLIQASDFRAEESRVNDALVFLTKHNLSNNSDPTLASTQMLETSYNDANPLESNYRAALIQNATRSVMKHISDIDLTKNPSYVNSNDQVSYEPSADNKILVARKAKKIVRKRCGTYVKHSCDKQPCLDEYDNTMHNISTNYTNEYY